jgi:hypothetical protein
MLLEADLLICELCISARSSPTTARVPVACKKQTEPTDHQYTLRNCHSTYCMDMHCVYSSASSQGTRHPARAIQHVFPAACIRRRTHQRLWHPASHMPGH